MLFGTVLKDNTCCLLRHSNLIRSLLTCAWCFLRISSFDIRICFSDCFSGPDCLTWRNPPASLRWRQHPIHESLPSSSRRRDSFQGNRAGFCQGIERPRQGRCGGRRTPPLATHPVNNADTGQSSRARRANSRDRQRGSSRTT